MVEISTLFGRLGNQMFQGAYIYAQFKRDLIKDIYVQDYRLFDEYREEIKDFFGTSIGFVPFVGIHVRRGDYVENPFYTDLLKTDYYERAISLFPASNFLVFSDDTEYCKTLEIFKGERFQIMEGHTELEDLNMMASCEQGNIIANSSFSYWAAYLNPSPIKKVIAPNKELWYSDGIERTICPIEWTRL